MLIGALGEKVCDRLTKEETDEDVSVIGGTIDEEPVVVAAALGRRDFRTSPRWGLEDEVAALGDRNTHSVFVSLSTKCCNNEDHHLELYNFLQVCYIQV